MDGSDDFTNDDIWSPSLREELFSDYNFGPTWDNNVDDLFLPRLSLPNPTALDHQTPPLQPWESNTDTPCSSTSNTQNISLGSRKRSHLDLPNFPLATNPTAASSNSSGRPPPPSSNHRPQPHRSTSSLQRAHLLPPPPSALDSDSSGSDTPYSHSDLDKTDASESEVDSTDRFVDLTQDSSPGNMPQSRRPAPRRINTPRRRNALRSGSLSDYFSERPSNPAKRRKVGNTVSQSSQRSEPVEGIDLTGVDDDKGLSKVLEQQRLATIKAQQEQASKPVKLSTLQCIICMENMQDVTATSCGMFHMAMHRVLSHLMIMLPGHLFCHSCLMEALIAGENQGVEPGKGIPKCPVCRKKVIRPLPTEKRARHDVVPLAIKLKVISRAGKGKERATD